MQVRGTVAQREIAWIDRQALAYTRRRAYVMFCCDTLCLTTSYSKLDDMKMRSERQAVHLKSCHAARVWSRLFTSVWSLRDQARYRNL